MKTDVFLEKGPVVKSRGNIIAMLLSLGVIFEWLNYYSQNV